MMDQLQLRRNRFPWSSQTLRLAAMLPAFGAVYILAYWLRFEDQLSGDRFKLMLSTIVPLLVVKSACFYGSGALQGWRRVVSFHDLVTLVKAATASSLAFAVVDYLLFPNINVPRSIFAMDWAGTVALLGALRSVSRLRVEGEFLFRSRKPMCKALIVGTDDSGEAVLNNLRRSPNLAYRVMGFTTLDPRLMGTKVCGVPVVGTVDDTCRMALRLGATEILVANSQLSGKHLRKLMEDASQHELTVKVLPSYEALLDGKLDLAPRRVSIEDLLRRDPVQLNQQEILHWIEGRTLMVTGSAGSIGSEICRQLLRLNPACLICVDRWESGQFFLDRELNRLSQGTRIVTMLADVGDLQRMETILREHQPTILFHAAAYKHVPLMEEYPGEAIKNIVLLTQGLANLADQLAVESFVMVSTDKAVNPTNVMGACKRVAELYVQSLAADSPCRFVTVRFGNVLDSAGSVVPIFREQIAAGGPVTVTHPDMTRYFMTIPEAAQLVIQAGAMGQGGEIFVLDMGSPVKIAELAQDMIRLSGLRLGEDIEIEYVGCRPGEKLYEELRVDGERCVATDHPKITVVECDAANRLETLRTVRRLENLANGSRDIILQELKRAVPQFQHATHVAKPNLRIARAA